MVILLYGPHRCTPSASSQFRHYRWQVAEIFRHAVDYAGVPVLARDPVDLTWLHRPLCALALTSCKRLLRQLPAGAIREATQADPGLEGVRYPVVEEWRRTDPPESALTSSLFV